MSSMQRAGSLVWQFTSLHLPPGSMTPQWWERGSSGMRPSFQFAESTTWSMVDQNQNPNSLLCLRPIHNGPVTSIALSHFSTFF